MTDKAKELILKINLIVSLVLILLIFPGTIIWLVFFPEIAFELTNTLIVVELVVGILFMILLPILGGIKQKPVKAEKIKLEINCYDELKCFLNEKLVHKGYKILKTSTTASCELTLFLKQQKFSTLDCFAIVNADELTDPLLEESNKCITEQLSEYYKGKTITDRVNMIAVFCVQRITPAFQRLVNGNIQQGLKNGRLPVGISFGGGNIYIAKQNDGFAIAKYKHLRKQFLDIMEIKLASKISNKQ